MEERQSLEWSSERTNSTWRDGKRSGKGEGEREGRDLCETNYIGYHKQQQQQVQKK